MLLRLNKKSVIKGAIGLFVAVAIAIFVLEITALPHNPHYTSLDESDTAFSMAFDQINTILSSYHLSIENTEKISENNYYSHNGVVALPNGGTLEICLESYNPSNPNYLLRLNGPTYSTMFDCNQWDVHQYPFLYEIAAYLCKDRFTNEQYQRFADSLQNNIREQLPTEELCASDTMDLRGLLFSYGSINYIVVNEEDKFYPYVTIYMPIYS